jgi:hypothetical protein
LFDCALDCACRRRLCKCTDRHEKAQGEQEYDLNLSVGHFVFSPTCFCFDRFSKESSKKAMGFVRDTSSSLLD